MNKLAIASLIIFCFASCTTSNKMIAQKANYTVIADDNEKVLKGYINRSVLESDTAFKWFKENMRYGVADSSAVVAFKKYGDQFTVMAFGGTWCHDTHAMLPVFYRLVEKSGFPESRITLVAVDRVKIGPDDLHKTHNVTNVPTFIVLKDGKELGRVVEFGKEGKIDKELGEIVIKAFNN